MADPYTKGQESITQAEHISPAKTGDNIDAKRTANYIYNPDTSKWERMTAVTGGTSIAAFSDSSDTDKKGLVDSDRHVQVDVLSLPAGGSSGTQYAEGDDISTTPTGTLAMVRDGSDQAEPLLQPTTPSDTQPVSATSLPLPTGASTSAKQDTIIGHVDGIETSLTSIDTDTSDLLTEMRILNGSMAMRVDDTSGTLYQGWAEPGTATSAASWRIRKVVTSGTPEDTTITFADGDRSFNNIWDNRASLSYS